LRGSSKRPLRCRCFTSRQKKASSPMRPAQTVPVGKSSKALRDCPSSKPTGICRKSQGVSASCCLNWCVPWKRPGSPLVPKTTKNAGFVKMFLHRADRRRDRSCRRRIRWNRRCVIFYGRIRNCGPRCCRNGFSRFCRTKWFSPLSRRSCRERIRRSLRTAGTRWANAAPWRFWQQEAHTWMNTTKKPDRMCCFLH